MAYPGRLRALVQPLRAYAGTPLQDLARRSGLTRLFGPEIEAIKERLPPLVPESFIDLLPTITPTRTNRSSRMTLLLGSL